MTPTFRWEVQTFDQVRGWHFTGQHPHGYDSSGSGPTDLAREVADTYGQFANGGRFRVVVWNSDEPVAMREHGPGTL